MAACSAALALAALLTGAAFAQDATSASAADLAVAAGAAAPDRELASSGRGAGPVLDRGAKVPLRVFPQTIEGLVVLYDNGPLVTHPGGGSGGADESRLQTALDMNILGFGHQVLNNNWVADDFTISDAAGWDVDTATFFAYQTNSTTTSTINDIRVRIWDGVPSAPGSNVVFGDTTTNRLAATSWENLYRVTDTTSGATNRPVMAAVATIATHFDPGTYWIDWQLGGTLASGPWAPPITINGVTNTGNGMQSLAGAAHVAAIDTGISGTLNAPQGFPFVLEGSIVAPEVALTKTVGDVIGVCAATDTISVPAGTQVEYCFHIENTGTMTLNFHTLVDDHLGTILDNQNEGLDPGEILEVLVTDTVTATVTNTATLTSSVDNPGGAYCSTDGPITVTSGSNVPGVPYPSQITVAGAPTTFDPLTVDLLGITHTWPDDFDLLLVAPTGQTLVIMSDVGGSNDITDVDLNLADAAATLLPDSTILISGSYRPTNFGAADTFPPVVPPGPYGLPAPAGAATLASQFGAIDPNGTWQLFVRDQFGGDAGQIEQWCLNITSDTLSASASDTATVTALFPDAAVDPTTMTSTLYPGQSEAQTLTIQNNGQAPLNWDLFEGPSGFGEVKLELRSPDAPIPLVLDDGVRENSIGLTAGGQFIWLNRFTPAVTDFPFRLDEISVLFPGASGINVGEIVDLYVYEDTDGDNNPGTGANFLGSETGVAVQAVDDVTFSVYPLTTPIALNGPGDVLIAVVNRTAGTAAGTFVAAIDQTASQVRSWVGIYTAGNPGNPPTLPADGFWNTIDGAGFPGNWMVRGLGQQTGCSSPEDLPWLGVTQNTGSTPVASTSPVLVTFFAGVLPVGLYEGLLCLDSNDPDTPRIEIPVTMVIDTMPFLDGFESGDTSAWSSTVP